MTGIKRMRETARSRRVSGRITIKKRIEIIITIRMKLVPQRLCSLELFITFSTVSGSPCSTQLMHLCSAP